MNAVLREKDEVTVLTNEAIEVHLTYLRSGFDAVQTALPVLRDKMDLLAANVDSKIEKTHAERVLEIQGLQKAIVWVISLASVVSGGVSITHTFNWI